MTETLVVGAGGLLGSAVAAELQRRGNPAASPRFEWTNGDGLTDRFTEELAAVATAAADNDRPWTAFWCAGIGTVGASDATHDSDVAHLNAFAQAAGQAAQIAPGRIALASSAGALYAGGRHWPATEQTPIAPTHTYGHSKRRQEQVMDELTNSNPRIGATSLRISNLYGPGQATNKPQGLLSHLIVNTLRRKPLSLYVPLDTSRDYLFVTDAARMTVDAVTGSPATGHDIRILAAERNHTVAQVLAIIGKMMKRRIPYLPTITADSDRQPPLLSFRSLYRHGRSRPSVSLEEGLVRTIDAVTAGMVA